MMFEIGKCVSCGQPSGQVFEFCAWCDTAPTACDELWMSKRDNERRRHCDQAEVKIKLSPINLQADISQRVYHGQYSEMS